MTTKREIELILLGIFLGIVITSLSKGFTGFSLEDLISRPIHDFLYPPKPDLSIEPIKWPYEHDNKQWVGISLQNNGTAKLQDLTAFYNFTCQNKSGKSILKVNSLEPNEKTLIEIESFLNTNCSFATDPVKFERYVDSQNRCYIRSYNVSTNVCHYCILQLEIAGKNFYRNYSYWYPFSQGELIIQTFKNITTASGCLDYAGATNKTDLKHLTEYDFSIRIYDISTGCIRGDIELSWCREYGYI